MRTYKVGIVFSLLVLTAFVAGLCIGPAPAQASFLKPWMVEASLGTRARMSATGGACVDASSSSSGCVNTGAQTFAGDKTFTGNITISSNKALYLNGATATDFIFSDGTGTIIGSHGDVTVGGRIISRNSTGGFSFGTVGSQFIGMAAATSQIDVAGNMKMANTLNVGTITLSGGTGTATVIAGSICVCTDSTANVSVKCAVVTTTLTATGTTTDAIKYICL